MKHLKISILLFFLFLHPINGGDESDNRGKHPQSSKQQQPAETNPKQREIHPRPEPMPGGSSTSLLIDDVPKGNYGLRLHIPRHYGASGVQFGEHAKEKPKISISGKRNFDEINPTEKEKRKAHDSENTGSGSYKKYARLNPGQISILNEYYEKDKYIEGQDKIKIKKEIVKKTSMTPDQIKFWFQNKRTEDRIMAKSQQQQVQSQNDELEQLRSQIQMLQQKVQELLHTVNIQQQQLLQYQQFIRQHVSQQLPNIGAVRFDRMATPSQPQEQQQHERSPQHFAQTEQYSADDFLQGDDQRENV